MVSLKQGFAGRGHMCGGRHKGSPHVCISHELPRAEFLPGPAPTTVLAGSLLQVRRQRWRAVRVLHSFTGQGQVRASSLHLGSSRYFHQLGLQRPRCEQDMDPPLRSNGGTHGSTPGHTVLPREGPGAAKPGEACRPGGARVEAGGTDPQNKSAPCPEQPGGEGTPRGLSAG